MQSILSSFNLKSGENIVKESKPSKLLLIATWLCLPLFVLTVFLITYLPPLFSTMASSAAKEALAEALGIPVGTDFNVASAVYDQVFGSIPPVVKVLIAIPFVLLVLVWLGWCLVMTRKHYQYQLAVTNLRVIGKAKYELLNSPLNEVRNANLEQSLWGKIFSYGSITVQTSSRTLTFKNIHNPRELYNLIMNAAREYCAH